MKQRGKCLAVLGSGSEVGKSVAAAALCRIFSDAGLSTAPFKTQNMSNNSYVTPDGGEIGRAQGVQAECARAAPSVHMNPLLLKPHGNNRSQMVLLGKMAGEVAAVDFRKEKKELFGALMRSLDLLRDEYDAVILEGAGSCAEVNLREGDMANFRTALYCRAPVLLVADISRGGVFAQVVGTLNLLTPEERGLVKGTIINRFNGDVSLFDDGVTFIERETGVPVLGVVPHFSGIDIDPEDSVVLDRMMDPGEVLAEDKINIAVVRLPFISNFSDFTPLIGETPVNLSYLSRPRDMRGLDMLIIPGSKNTRADLQWLFQTGWAGEIMRFASGGGRVTGICGGYQMLGNSVLDPHGIEGPPGETKGLGLLDVSTEFGKEKRVTRVTGRWLDGGFDLTGYEIHVGVSRPGVGVTHPIEIFHNGSSQPDGALSRNGRVFGTYLHGLFDEPEFRKAFLKSLRNGIVFRDGAKLPSPLARRDIQYDLLAAHFKKHLDIPRIFEIAGIKYY